MEQLFSEYGGEQQSIFKSIIWYFGALEYPSEEYFSGGITA